MNVSNRVIWLAMAAWGACIGAAFWRYEWRYLRPVARPVGAATYDLNGRLGALPEAPLAVLDTDRGTVRLRGANPVTLLNFWSPTCACSEFIEPHVRALVQDYSSRGVRFLTVVECGDSAAEQSAALAVWHNRKLPTMPIVLDPAGRIARAFGVWAAPGAVILSRQSRIAYVGSYNAARFCADPATAWAQQALLAILSDRRPANASTPFYGCQTANRE